MNADILEGGEGDDYIVGFAGDDIYLFSLGWGQDSIVDYLDEINTVRFGPDILPTDILLAETITSNST